ncbi:MAG: hypothetical protein ABR505_09965 [Actinomycetota bacterium]
MRERLAKLEEDILQVPGVESVRIAGEEAPTEIHIVGSPERPPKQLVRDIQSLAAARFGIPIDHRIVSVVVLDRRKEKSATAADDARPVLDSVIVASKRRGSWVKVALQWPDGEITDGAAAAGPSRDVRARAAASACIKALEPALKRMNATLQLDQIQIHRIGSLDSVLVGVTVFQDAGSNKLLGSATIHDDVATATVHAILHATNRKFR